MESSEFTFHIWSGDDDVKLVFPKTTKVKEVEEAAIKELGLEGGSDTFELVYDGRTLEPDERPLVSFSIPQRACLELVATGQGV